MCNKTYSVMQSEGKSYCGDVVLDSFNNVPREEDNILEQIYRNKIFSYFYDKNFNLKPFHENVY